VKRLGLATQILIGLILGVAVGAIFYGSDTAISILQPVGDIFIHLIKMIVVPIVISALIVAVAGVGDIKKLGKLGGKTILYFEDCYNHCYCSGDYCRELIPPWCRG